MHNTPLQLLKTSQAKVSYEDCQYQRLAMNISIPKQREAEIVYEVLGGGGGYCEFNVPVLGPC